MLMGYYAKEDLPGIRPTDDGGKRQGSIQLSGSGSLKLSLMVNGRSGFRFRRQTSRLVAKRPGPEVEIPDHPPSLSAELRLTITEKGHEKQNNSD
jgi:hypothetical protein